MTALAASRNTKQMNSPDANLDSLYCPLAAVKVFKGGLVGINASGYLEPAASGSNKQLKIVGVVAGPEESYDNTAGSPGDLSVKVLRGVFQLANSATTDAVTQADQGRIVYAVDDQTVARTPALGARPPAGRVMQVDTDGIWIDTTDNVESEQIIEVLMLATADLSTKQFWFVKQDTSNGVVVCAAGEDALGVVQNAPAAAAMAIVRTFGKTRCIAGVAIAQADFVASGAAGKAKVASRLVQATGAGSNVLGRALTLAAGDLSPFELHFNPRGVIPTTDA